MNPRPMEVIGVFLVTIIIIFLIVSTTIFLFSPDVVRIQVRQETGEPYFIWKDRVYRPCPEDKTEGE